MNVGMAIARARKIKYPGKSRAHFARLVGVSVTGMSFIERGERGASTKMLEKICKQLDVPFPVLMWFALEEKDVRPKKRSYFISIKEGMDDAIGYLLTDDVDVEV